MSKITLSTLLRMMPMDEEQKKEALATFSTLNESEKYELSMKCWKLLARQSSLEMTQELNDILSETFMGKRKYNVNDFSEVKTKKIINFKNKLANAQNEEELEKVQKEISQMMPSKPKQE